MAQLRDGSWQGSVTLPDKRHRLGGFKTQALAEAWEASMKVAHEQGRPLPVKGLPSTHPDAHKKPGDAGGATLGPIFDRVRTEVWTGQKAAVSSIRNGGFVVDYFGRNKALLEIDEDAIDAYVATLVAAGNSNGTINRKLAALSKMLRFAHAKRKLARLPVIERKREPKGRERELWPHEETKLLATLRLWGEHLYADFVEFLLDTGCRLSEGYRAEHTAFVDGKVTFWNTKNGKPRTIPLTARAKAAVARRANQQGGPFSEIEDRRFRDCWNGLRAHLKMPDVVPHTLRHTCCTRLVRAGFDLSRVSIWMGHTTMQTTVRYRHLLAADLEGMQNVLEKSLMGVKPGTVPNTVPERNAA